ncbi:hypothetical protein Glove_212g59 [Diversispora epigaea]|uniref:Uncharacterized protein n=1 Tax=Diversispora epigaea TaxID=1348612 RepID=A0A397IPQ8_9GLOM|nr:hypothetical protein Glove_212g59 [Diversispora epigaea]
MEKKIIAKIWNNDQQSMTQEYNNQKSDPIILTRIVSFLTSVILTIAFRAMLQTVHVIAHTQRHERRLEYQRMSSVIPCKNLLSGLHIWNLVIIDNIDFVY